MTKTVIVCDRCEREMPLASKIAAGTYCWDICLVCASTLTVAEIFARVVRLTAGESGIAWWPTRDEAGGTKAKRKKR